MKDEKTKASGVNIAWLVGATLILSAIAVTVAVIALRKYADGSSSSSSTAASMSSADMAHMQPLPIDGITAATSDRGGTQLRGVRRGDVLEFRLEARPVWWSITDNQRLAAYSYNGIVPGPQIRVRNGQRVRVRVRNLLPVETSVHWHGIGVPNSQDGVPGVTQKPIAPGGSFVYEFAARPAGQPNGGGTFFYHSHLEEDRQMSAGLSGTFIIEPGVRRSRSTVDKTLVISEWTADARSGRTRGVMAMDGMWPNFFTLNGRSYPDTDPISIKSGRLARLRLVNAGQFAHPLHLHGTAFQVTARDGHPARDRGLRDTLTLESGERADIQFRLPKGKWIFHCHIGHHMTNDGKGPGGLITVIRSS